jgi:signal transduction histidine kinase
MSHELRTPLNAILGYTELIVDQIYGEVPQKILEIMSRVQKSSRHLLGLINDVLDMSKIEAGQLQLSLRDYSFPDTVNTVVAAMEPLVAEKSLRLTIDVDADLPLGFGDDRRLAQVLLNLVGNAVKFTDHGGVSIGAKKSDGQFLVSVADTGPGIPRSEQRRIFEEFQQVDSSSTRMKGGTGLGLAIAKRIVEMHGGRLWVESAMGAGSTFYFSIPVRTEEKRESQA